ncbi:SNF2 domain-containing protein [Kribbella pratensis]|uniref:SNF2 domain-containing protein n=2 Tax=Kribbella pratensis TaxID=2512112 RepID=A0ABY2FHQ0_9ACTN|nr:SNF2 domain-containing protein [Kribbella pratensis]
MGNGTASAQVANMPDGLAIGALVEVRGQRWIVGDVDSGDSCTLVTLQSTEDGRYGDTLEVVWEVEPGRRVLPTGSLPEITARRMDPPERLAAFLDAVRWSAVTSADSRLLQAPFRSGVAIEDYQLEPVARAVDAPRVNLLLADDVGLGKTIEAGLVAQELMLRHRARRVMIICPAGLTLKWRDELSEKFGLDFTIVDSDRCADVRRTYGSAANPFHIYPLTIVSLPWLRGPKAQRLLREVVPAEGPSYPRTFDLLVLDEAHHVAPAAPKQRYAVDSQQTKLIRWLAPHFTHRLFLSATPHNGYQESFTALLEILDDQRFARGVEPDRRAIRESVVRRLKRDIVNADGQPRFVERLATAIPVEYPDSEREIHGLLSDFARVRRQRIATRGGRKATDLVTLLLKKRMFSSPAALAHTVGVYIETLETKRGTRRVVADDDVPEWLDEFFEVTATYDDEELAYAEDDAIGRSQSLQPTADNNETSLLRRIESWALAQEARPDAKARELVKYLRAVCRPDGENWTNERVVVFTEYRDTQRWLADILRQEGLGGDRLELLHGGLRTEDRERLRLAFQRDPSEHPVRILLATDAASEGIDLQNHCHRLVNYDIPFNPNKLEQRIGRVDRYGQTEAPDIRHFVGTGWDRAVDSYEADLEFLSRVANKVARMEEDLGAVNSVLADAVQRRMLGQRVDVDVEKVHKPTERDLPAEATSGVREQVRRLRDNIDQTTQALNITANSVKRVVDTALGLARQQPLKWHLDEKALAEGMYDVPPLTGSWQRATTGLTEKLDRPGEEPRQLPITFDGEVARGRDDVVLAHLNHPLVAMSTRLLRAAVSSPEVGLHRVTAVVSDDPALEDVLVGAYSRFVLVGADGVRLHEEVLYAGGWIPQAGRFRRLENLTTLGGLLDRALSEGVEASDVVQARIAERWPSVSDGLLAAIDWRARTRQESLDRQLAQRQEAEEARITASLDQFAATLRDKLAEEDDDGMLITAMDLKSPEELAQYRRDRASWETKLAGINETRERELALVADRYRDTQWHQFPVAVVFVVPRQEAIR